MAKKKQKVTPVKKRVGKNIKKSPLVVYRNATKVTVAQDKLGQKISEKNMLSALKKLPELKYLTAAVRNQIWMVACGVFTGFLTLYISTAPRTIVGYADSDILLTVGSNLGVAHPPGYALYMLLLNFFIHSPIPGSVAFKGHVLSAVLHSGALALLFVAGVWMVDFLKINYEKTVNVIHARYDASLVSLLGVVGLGSSFYFWLWGTVAEKYALLVFLTALMIFLSIRIATVKKSEQQAVWWVLLWIVLGASILHHLTAVVLVPMVMVLAWKEKLYHQMRLLGISVAGFVTAGIVCVGLVWQLNQSSAAVSWNFAQSWEGLWNHLIRSDFAGTALSTGKEIPLFPSFDLQRMMAAVQPYLKVMIAHFNAFNVVMAIVGIYGLWLSRKLNVVIYAGVLGATVFLPLFIGWSGDFGSQMIGMRQYLMGYVFMAILMTAGWWLVLMRLRKVFDLLTERKVILSGVVVVLSLIYGGVSVRANYDDVNLRNADFIHRYYAAILEEMPDEAVLACFSDISCFSLIYLQNVEGLRKDVTLIPNSYPFVKQQLDAVSDLKGFDYPDNPFLTFDYLTWNIGKRPVFVVDINRQMLDLVGVRLGFSFYIPYGYYGELSNVIPEDYRPVTDYVYTEELKAVEYPSRNLASSWYKLTVARAHELNGLTYQLMDKRSWGTPEFNLTADLLYDVEQLDKDNVEGVRASDERTKPSGGHYLGVHNDRDEQIKRIRDGIDNYLVQGRLSHVMTGLLGLLIINPRDIDARIRLAEVYEKMNNYKFALIEYKHVLKYQPDNQAVVDKVSQLEALQ